MQLFEICGVLRESRGGRAVLVTIRGSKRFATGAQQFSINYCQGYRGCSETAPNGIKAVVLQRRSPISKVQGGRRNAQLEDSASGAGP